ncbi:MAG: amidase family protein [Lentihominibacter sp.]|jgi:aspartyl-tRNA(Asn)/glutamyl-tRNA(Gln) amidotransferase subunit A
MKLYIDDMILTADSPTTAGSKMLEGYVSTFEAEVVTRLKAAGHTICGKAPVSEFSIDFVCGASQVIKSGEAEAVVGLEVNGANMRSAALEGLTFIKPTYGCVSRFGTIPVACSGEAVGIMAAHAGTCAAVLSGIAGHDEKDGTSLPEEKCSLVKESGRIEKVLEIKDFADAEETRILAAAQAAWNILMSAELCNNVSRYDGVKYGYRTDKYNDIDDLYTGSRTESFGYLLKSTILFGSEALSSKKYMDVYDKAMRVRRVIREAFDKIFEEYDAVVMPVCSKDSFSADEITADKYIAYSESAYTALPLLTGLPAVVSGGKMIMGKAFADTALLNYAKSMGGER